MATPAIRNKAAAKYSRMKLPGKYPVPNPPPNDEELKRAQAEKRTGGKIEETPVRVAQPPDLFSAAAEEALNRLRKDGHNVQVK